MIAALSGGSDSSALLLLLKPHLDRIGARLLAVTVDHALREASAGEAQRAAEFAASLGCAHRTLRWEGPKPAAGLPAAARAARYRLLAEAAGQAGAEKIVTGHTADDQAETVRMRRLRGPGRGLAGMAPVTLFDGRFWIMRPLLAVSRETLRDLLRQCGAGWIEDPSNSDERFERARLRLGGDRESAKLTEMALHVARQRAAEAENAARLIHAHADRPAPGLVRLAPGFLQDSDRAAAVTALRFLLACVGGKTFPVEAPRAEALFDALGRPGRVTLGGAVAEQRQGAVFLRREERGIASLVLGSSAEMSRLAWTPTPYPSPQEGGGREPSRSISNQSAALQERMRHRDPPPPCGEGYGVGVQSQIQTPTAVILSTGAIFDGRYRILPAHPSPGLIVPWGEAADANAPRPVEGVPQAVLRAAARAEPAFLPPGGAAPAPLAGAGLEAVPILAPFHAFLSGFDLPLARELAGLFGAAQAPMPPYRSRLAELA